MSTPIRYSQEPVELSLDGWLLEGTPVPGCKTCAASCDRRSRALKRKDWRVACAAARDIRNHGREHSEAA